MHFEPTPQCGANCSQLLWNTKVGQDKSGLDIIPIPFLNPPHPQGTYSTNIFGARAVDVINTHDVSQPLFMYLAWQGVHAPQEAPVSYWSVGGGWLTRVHSLTPFPLCQQGPVQQHDSGHGAPRLCRHGQRR